MINLVVIVDWVQSFLLMSAMLSTVRQARPSRVYLIPIVRQARPSRVYLIPISASRQELPSRVRLISAFRQ